MPRRYHALRNAFVAAAIAGAAAWWWRRPFRLRVEGTSMQPALQPGDFLVAVRRGSVERGALVVIEHPDRAGFEMVKRVEALPGERAGHRVLGTDEYWLVGDSSGSSTDSRAFGPVGLSAIRGVVRFRYWPPSRWGSLRK